MRRGRSLLYRPEVTVGIEEANSWSRRMNCLVRQIGLTAQTKCLGRGNASSFEECSLMHCLSKRSVRGLQLPPVGQCMKHAVPAGRSYGTDEESRSGRRTVVDSLYVGGAKFAVLSRGRRRSSQFAVSSPSWRRPVSALWVKHAVPGTCRWG